MNLYVFTIIATEVHKSTTSNTQYILLYHGIANDSFELFRDKIEKFTEHQESKKEHDGWTSKPEIFNSEKFSALKILGELKKKLPDLVENTVTRDKLEKLEKALED